MGIFKKEYYFQNESIKNNLNIRKKEINKKIFSQRIPPSPLKNRPILVSKKGFVPEDKEENQSKNKEEPKGPKNASKTFQYIKRKFRFYSFFIKEKS